VLALGFIFCVYFISAKPIAAGILVAKQTLAFPNQHAKARTIDGK